VTVLDTSGAVDFLLGTGAAAQVEALIASEGELAAPDVLVFEVIAVLRRMAFARELPQKRARAAVEDLGDLPLDLFPSLPLRERVWALRRNLTAADALFAALAEALDEPLATKDRALGASLARHTAVAVLELDTAP
jgi:predicted nucleic acid-binding protein